MSCGQKFTPSRSENSFFSWTKLVRGEEKRREEKRREEKREKKRKERRAEETRREEKKELRGRIRGKDGQLQQRNGEK